MDTAAGTYDRLHASGIPVLSKGQYAGEVLPVDGDPRWGLSAVLVPPPRLATRLAGIATLLVADRTGRHMHYRPRDIHFTVRSLEAYQTDVDQATVERHAATLHDCLRGLTFEVRIRGIAVTGSGIIACGYPSAAFGILRARLHQSAATRPALPPSVDSARIRNTCHASLLVMRPPAEPEAELAARADALRHQEFGSFLPHRIHLVRYTFAEQRVRMHRLTSVVLP
ncbi:hypothetical protein GCM10029976_055160 [Kribbella albertanoniae]|uniref:2'-5' RNA ligase family protein n=1 Tax=Kribbella albertanoniae TaxID=1266829 RepID=A0A4R4Q6P1_9ACTN|nr:hypothetical protein [Kribbella albertanoniae]TDC30689.1 hypothetical protein E1261_12835 [Kribbella albertanoniae]